MMRTVTSRSMPMPMPMMKTTRVMRSAPMPMPMGRVRPPPVFKMSGQKAALANPT